MSLMNSEINVCHALSAIQVPTILLNRTGDEDVLIESVRYAAARAIRCAQAISDGVRELGLHARAGLHTGECEIVAGKIGGIAVHIGARVAAEAQAEEVVVSSTVKDLVAGSGLTFADRGHVQLKGVPGEWHLYTVAPALGDYRGAEARDMKPYFHHARA